MDVPEDLVSEVMKSSGPCRLEDLGFPDRRGQTAKLQVVGW